MANDPDCYPGTDVLINLLNIRDGNKLRIIEATSTYSRAREDVPLTLSRDGFCSLHRHLFQDVYPWAGEIRPVDLSKGNSIFQSPKLIGQSLDKLASDMSADDGLKSSDVRVFAPSAGKHLVKLHAVHPFRDGNERTNLLLLKLLAKNAGHELELPLSAKNRWMTATQIGLAHSDSGPMTRLILDHIKAKENEKEPIKEDDGR